MKVSLRWLRDYLQIDLPPEQIGDILTGTGLEVEGIEEKESIPGGLAGIVVGKVVECGKHPNADRLSLTKVDVGHQELLSIVCGAPNVAADQKVLVATVGTMLHPTEGEPFKIKKGKIRGEVSEGMICAEDEIGLGTDHDGIMVLPEDTPIGKPAAEVFELQSDHVFEIGLTPNRSDATNHLGVAFDLAAALRVNHDSNAEVAQPDLSAFEAQNGSEVTVEVKDPELCPRYAGLVLKDLKIGPSPDWMQDRLRAVDVRPINNVVDITNYVLHEMGQPLHAFDLEKIGGSKVIVQTLPEGTEFISLDETTRKLRSEDLMICDGNNKPMCIAGVFGGLNSGVTDKTTAIFLESAHFDAGSVRRTSMSHNLRTDAAKIFEKGSDPNIAADALKRAALLMQEYAGATISSQLIDHYPKPINPLPVRVRYQRINELIGIEIAPDKVHAILETMNMDIIERYADSFVVGVPTNKSDVTREVDVIEEVLRIFGFNNVPTPSEITTAMVVAPDPDPVALRDMVGDLLIANGFHEMMALSLSESKYYGGGPGADRVDGLVYINNTSNVHLDIMRPDLLMSGLEAVKHNANRRNEDLKLFEFGRAYKLDGEKYQEDNRLSILLTGRHTAESWHGGNSSEPVSFYTLKAAVNLVLNRLGISGFQTEEAPNETYSYGLRYRRGPMVIVDLGRVRDEICTSAGCEAEVLFATFHWDNLLRVLPKKRMKMQELNKYPTVRRDLALVVDKSVKFADLERLAFKSEKKLLTYVNLFDVYENEEQLGESKKSYALSFILENQEKTLTDKEVDKAMNRISGAFTAQLGAELRR
ncbi:MAG: phenylalanine--tRNA ligase subunit beta [Bacteroidota bacterium]